MSRPTKQELHEELDEAEGRIEEIASVLVDPELSPSEKVEAIEGLVFDDEDAEDGQRLGGR